MSGCCSTCGCERIDWESYKEEHARRVRFWKCPILGCVASSAPWAFLYKDDPTRAQHKCLIVYHWPGRGHYSRDNRRLKCLKDFQREIGNRQLFVRIVAMQLPASTMERLDRNPEVWRMLRDFLPACTTRNDGRSVAVRR